MIDKKTKTICKEILIVEDNAANLKLLTRVLTDSGYSVRPALSAEFALRFMAEITPDLILLDVKLTDIDGYEVCRRLRSQERLRKIPVIFISALDQTINKIEGFNVGGNDYITKPFDTEELLARIRTHLKLHELSELMEQKVRERTEKLKIVYKKLRESEELHRITLENILSLVFITDDDGKFTFLSPNISYILGYTKEDIEKMGNISNLLGDRLSYENELEKQHEISNIKRIIKCKDGNERVFLVSVKRVKIKGGTILYTCHDITDLMQAEDELRGSEQRFRTLVSNIPGIVYRCACDEHWTMYYISDFIEELSGYPAFEFINNKVRSFTSIIHQDDQAMVSEVIDKALAKRKAYVLEYRIVAEGGTIKWVYEKGQGIYNDQKQLLWLDGAIFDITDQKKTQDSLNEYSKKLEISKIALEQKNIFLSEINDQLEAEKNRIKQNLLGNINTFILPTIEKLKAQGSDLDFKYLEVLKDSLKDITSSFGLQIMQEGTIKLSSREIEISNMIKYGLSNKEIANTLNISPKTVERYRNNIRQKLGLVKTKINLVSYLNQISY